MCTRNNLELLGAHKKITLTLKKRLAKLRRTDRIRRQKRKEKERINFFWTFCLPAA